jgi:hypothetical protein
MLVCNVSHPAICIDSCIELCCFACLKLSMARVKLLCESA